MKKKITIILVIISMQLLFSQEEVRIAIMDFTAKNISESVAGIVTDLIRTEFFNTGLFRVVERNEMDKILAEQSFQASGCTDTDCAVEIGKLLSVNKMLLGSVSKLGEKYIINGRIVDIELAEMQFAATGYAENESMLDQGVKDFVNNISAKIHGTKTRSPKPDKTKPVKEKKPKKEKKEKPVRSRPSSSGKRSTLLGQSLGFMAMGAFGGVMGLVYNSKAKTAHSEYSSLVTPGQEVSYFIEWTSVQRMMNTRQGFYILSIGALSAGTILLITDIATGGIKAKKGWLGTLPALMLSGAVMNTATFFIYNSQLKDAQAEYSALTDTVSPAEEWDDAWKELENIESKRNKHLISGVVLGSAGITLMIINGISNSKKTAMNHKLDTQPVLTLVPGGAHAGICIKF